MHPNLFNLGPFSVHSYGLLVAIAFAIGILLTLHFAKKEKIAPELVLDLAIYVVISAVLGARFLYVAGQWDYFRTNPAEIIMLQNGGLVFLGGLIFSFIAVLIFAQLKKIKLLKLLDAIAPGAALGYAIGRIGCFLNGCCFGLPAKLPWGVVFPHGSLADFYCSGEKLHPTQLYSSLAMFLVFLVLIRIYQNKKFNGQLFFWWLILYSIYRFSVEFFRYSPMHWARLTPSQWLVIFTFSAGIWGLNHYRNKS